MKSHIYFTISLSSCILVSLFTLPTHRCTNLLLHHFPHPMHPLTGFHHVTAITAQVRANLQFYTQTLGLRLVKRTVNQDDVSAYHLFYADGLASPGSDLTFFDWRTLPRERRGRQSISRTGLRVDSVDDKRNGYWVTGGCFVRRPHQTGDKSGQNSNR